MKDIQQINKGLVKDINQEFQPEATYRFMLNGMLETLIGEKGGVANERGNVIILATPSGITSPNVIGDCLLPNQDKVIFITGNDGNQEVQIIGLHKENNTFVELVRTECLEFSQCDQIDCIFKVHNGCDIIIYFTDHANKYKSINITAIENTNRYINPTHAPWTGAPVGTLPNIPTVDPGVGIGTYGWQCDAFFLTPVSEHPNIYFHKQSSNGNLRTGAYTFFVRLLDLDLNPTDWIAWSNPIYVKQGDFNFNTPSDNTDGFYSDVTVEKFTPRSLSLIIDNLDINFQYYEIGIMERSLNTGLPTFAYRTGQRRIPPAVAPATNGSDIFVFNDVSDSRFITTDIASLLTKTRKIDVVQAHSQINNRLVVGNIAGTTRDWSSFQQVSNDIQVEYFTYNNVGIDGVSCDDKHHFVSTGQISLDYEIANNVATPATAVGVNYSSPEFLSYGMSLMRDEVYALGIIYVFSDGSESPVFHIPGRPKFSNVALDWTIDGDIAVTAWDIGGYDYAAYAQLIQSTSHATLDVFAGAVLAAGLGLFDGQVLSLGTEGVGVPHTDTGTWASNFLTNLPQDDVISNVEDDEYKYLYGFKDHITCCYHVPFTNNACQTTDLERWQYYNTAIRRKTTAVWIATADDKPTLSGSNPTYTFEGGYRGVPGYFNTGLEYPAILDCSGTRIYPEGPVRHHRMPDHRIEQIFDYNEATYDFSLLGAGGPARMNNAAWLALSNIQVGANYAAGEPWAMSHAEKSLKLYPLGLNLHNVEPPTEYRDEVVGYYIVRSDRTNNKTVIDKGFMNVCDTSISARHWPTTGFGEGLEAVDKFSALENNTMHTTDFFLTPTHPDQVTESFFIPADPTKAGNGHRIPTHSWWNIMEIHTPKSTFNERETLQADYIKLESTVFGDMFFDSELIPWPTTITGTSYVERYAATGWNTGASLMLNRHKYPRVQNISARHVWSFIYNIPLSGLAYTDYNESTSTSGLGQNSTTLWNKFQKQRSLVARYHQSCTAVEPRFNNDPAAVLSIVSDTAALLSNNKSTCDLNRPFYYDQLKMDVIDDFAKSMYSATSLHYGIDRFMNRGDASAAYYGTESWAHFSNVTSYHKWSIPNSPYMYYVGLKSTAVPYEDFDAIKYIKMHSYLIPFDPVTNPTVQDFPVTGGDTFIQRFQFEKGMWEMEDPAKIGTPKDNTFAKFCTSLTVGYVESEINSQFRHLQNGDLFRTYPFNDRKGYYNFLYYSNELHGTTQDEVDAYHLKQEIFYRYKIDYSNVNEDVPVFPLPSTFDFCSSCSESFPNTILYSEISLDSQVQDFYKLFLTNSEKAIPSYTGSIQDLFVKNSDLYVHTENNLWKLSVAPQTMKTSADTVEVGQGEFLERDPIKLFNNEDGFARGGTIDKFASVFGSNGELIWLDRNGGTVYALSGEGPKILSNKGMSRWFSNNSEVELDTQFRALTSLPYPHKGTACNINVGYKGVLDPEHNRYILTKKDYKLLPSVLVANVTNGQPIAELTIVAGVYNPATIIGQYYYDNDGFYVGIAVGTDPALKSTLVSDIDYNDELLAENKSWTISYSLKDQSWASFHSYIPNWMYNDTHTFYSFVDNTTSNINLSIWEHNYGEFTDYYGTKFDFIIDYIYKKNPYQEKTFDTIEYTSNVWLEDLSTNRWIEVPFTTFDRFYVYNNNQLSNLKTVTVGNLTPYANLAYTVGDATAHKTRNIWKINRLRDMAVSRLALSESLFSTDWSEATYQTQFDNGFGYIDHVINPAAIDVTKSVYTIERLTDKYLGVRLFFNPASDYKITFNLLSGQKRIKI